MEDNAMDLTSLSAEPAGTIESDSAVALAGTTASDGGIGSSATVTPEKRLLQERSIFEKEQSEWEAHLQRMEYYTAQMTKQKYVSESDAAGITGGHTMYASESDVPYKHVKVLGRGGFGWVDEVQGPKQLHGIPASWGGSRNEVYARKTIPLTRRRLTDNSAAIRNEVDIVSKLRHHHLIRIICTYQCDRNFGILMSPVAEGDLKEYMEETDSLSASKDKESHLLRMIPWTGCLMGVVQFLHHHRIRHKDIKPANILVRGSQVFLTDFGIAKDLQDDTNTATTGNPGFHTALYAAPEVHNGDARGRGADIYSLGCVFLEMAIIMFGLSLDKFHKFVTTDGIRAYAKNEQKILQNFLYFWAQWYLQWRWYDLKLQYPRPAASPIFDFAVLICHMSFLMLDPDPSTRITAEQLIDVVASKSLIYREIMLSSCEPCRAMWRQDQDAPLHSWFKDIDRSDVPDDPTRALEAEPPQSWDAAKRKWLHHHMHW
ncbi:MAG: hypothetical protein M1812_006801 [Candelaria pacifica]|nr:MAG: hypothetical protein M1812_006801 [Candelaria pacifica]